MYPRVLWFTGLSGSGKTTIAKGLYNELRRFGKKVKILDGDEIRESLHTELGFTHKDIELNNEKIALLCKSFIKTYDFIIVPIIAPFTQSRQLASRLIGPSFSEIYIKSSLSTVINRDVKGLYKKALNGEINNFIGIDPLVPYEPPKKPDLILDTETEGKSVSITKLLKFVLENNCEL